MTRKKTIKDFTADELVQDLAYRLAEESYRPGMTMSQMELCVWDAFGSGNYAAPALGALLARMPIEQPTAKLCPKCGKRSPVKARDRARTLRTLCGEVTLNRNYHYCEGCQLGFYPVDRTLDLPEEGELTREMEKRVLDFAINDVFDQGAERWNMHYRQQLSDNLLRRVAGRVGAQCEAAHPGHLQEALKPATDAAEVLVVEMDGSMVPIRGAEPWKEVKVGVTYRHDPATQEPVANSTRYTAVIGTVANFAPVLQELLITELVDAVHTVVWLGDGAAHNWTLAEQLVPDAIQVLDWYHAVEHAVDCGKVLLGEESPWLPLWQRRAEQLLAEGDVDALIRELMDCLTELEKRRRDKREALESLDELVRYYRNNASRMRYRTFREHGFPVGSGAVESAHRHVIQARMKRAGQRWELTNARQMAQLRAAYRTGGAAHLYDAVQRARRQTERRAPLRDGRRHQFHFARQGERDRTRAAAASSN